MLKQLLLATVFAAATSPAAFAMSDAECSALMNKPGVYTSTGKYALDVDGQPCDLSRDRAENFVEAENGTDYG